MIEDRGAYLTSGQALRPLKIHFESQPSGGDGDARRWQVIRRYEKSRDLSEIAEIAWLVRSSAGRNFPNEPTLRVSCAAPFAEETRGKTRILVKLWTETRGDSPRLSLSLFLSPSFNLEHARAPSSPLHAYVLSRPVAKF